MKFWRLPDTFIRLLNMTNRVSGSTKRYTFQMSHGGQQVKLYEKEKYKNHINTPLRQRARTIMRLAMEDPHPTLQEKLRQLYREYPYHLKKERKENLKFSNFYFGFYIPEGTLMRLYQQRESFPQLDHDYIIMEFPYKKGMTIPLEYKGYDEEKFYATVRRTVQMSNVLQVFWE